MVVLSAVHPMFASQCIGVHTSEDAATLTRYMIVLSAAHITPINQSIGVHTSGDAGTPIRYRLIWHLQSRCDYARHLLYSQHAKVRVMLFSLEMPVQSCTICDAHSMLWSMLWSVSSCARQRDAGTDMRCMTV